MTQQAEIFALFLKAFYNGYVVELKMERITEIETLAKQNPQPKGPSEKNRKLYIKNGI